MHVADRRHGLDVVAHLRAPAVTDRDVLLAGLLHDCGKGDTGRLAARRLVARRARSARGSSPWPAVSRAGGRPWTRLRAPCRDLGGAAGRGRLPARTVELIRFQDAPRDPEYGERLRAADEAN